MLHFKQYDAPNSELASYNHKPLVMLHGLFGSLENLAGIARPLAAQRPVYSLDLPNHGRSAHTDICNLEVMAVAVSDWLLEQGLTQVDLLGHSLGGKVAMEVALTVPERIGRLLVVDIAPVGYSSGHDNVFQGLMSINLDTLKSRQEADQHLQSYVQEIAVRSFLLKNLVKQASGGFAWRVNLAGLHAGYSDLLKENSRDMCFPGPTLFVKGGDSDYLQESYRDEILARFPDTSLKVVSNTGHWLHAEKPDIVAKIVNNFLGDSE